MEEQQMIQFFASKQDLRELEEKLKQMMAEQTDRLLVALDEQTGILRKLDQELVLVRSG